MTEITNNNNKDLTDKTTQLVNKIFKDINENQNIPEAVKEIIQNLSSPYMKIALDMPNLFTFESHQARVFLESVGKLGTEWSKLEDVNNNFLKKLNDTVERINNLEKYNNKDFIQFQDNLERSVANIKKRAVILQKRKEEKMLGQQKINDAKQLTEEKILKKTHTFQNIPVFVNKIIHEEWKNVLVLLFIRNGVDSEPYESHLSFIDSLLDLTFTKKSFESNLNKYKTLLNKYQQGLALVAFNNQEIKEKKNLLIQFFKDNHKKGADNYPEKMDKADRNIDTIIPTKHLKESKIPAKTEKIKKAIITKDSAQNDCSPSSSVLEPKKEINQNPKPSIAIEKPVNAVDYEETIKSFTKGSWFEIMGENGQMKKAKLSWISPISGNHLFVDSQGLKMANKTIEEIKLGLAEKTIKIIKTI